MSVGAQELMLYRFSPAPVAVYLHTECTNFVGLRYGHTSLRYTLSTSATSSFAGLQMAEMAMVLFSTPTQQVCYEHSLSLDNS